MCATLYWPLLKISGRAQTKAKLSLRRRALEHREFETFFQVNSKAAETEAVALKKQVAFTQVRSRTDTASLCFMCSGRCGKKTLCRTVTVRLWTQRRAQHRLLHVLDDLLHTNVLQIAAVAHRTFTNVYASSPTAVHSGLLVHAICVLAIYFDKPLILAVHGRRYRSQLDHQERGCRVVAWSSLCEFHLLLAHDA